jgi:hypothetical protein
MLDATVALEIRLYTNEVAALTMEEPIQVPILTFLFFVLSATAA